MTMLNRRLLPVVVLEEAGWALPLADALLAGGLDIVEITLRTDAALDGIRQLRAAHPRLRIGAGTVIDADIVPQLVDLGVDFAVAPGLGTAVIEATLRVDMPLFAGIANPTDIETARAFGLRTLKFFPAEPLGGAKMLKALIGPYRHTGLRFIPTGGIDLGNAGGYAALPEVAAIGGSWFVTTDLMRAGRWDEIATRTRAAIAIMSGGESGPG
ncbi:MAG: bifunctional 4-hydroxy-2-oxoglutarate aldolase/2-dehydro-3-deoxy-phosphogluconate aldolase [Planctomycetes bacterium]|nr:bifunctional 4-hydroxy-2-oxoglutarate aldolase/2-dehydro-3-deoxy-phosphogluconate aldolase [Planctomycetota bacterium]